MANRNHIPACKKPDIKASAWFGIVVILIFVGGFLLWSFLAPLESAAIAPGQLLVAGSHRVVQHLEGGIIEKIKVKDGDYVKKGQVIVVLDKTKASSSSQIMKNEELELMAIEARLITALKNEADIAFPSLLLAHHGDAKVAQLLKAQKAILNANREDFAAKIKIYHQQIQQLNQQIQGIKAQLQSNSTQHQFIEKELKDIRVLAKKRLIKQSRLLALEREAAKLSGEMGKNEAEIARLEQKIGETKLQINAAENNRRKELLDELRQTQQKLNEITEKSKAASDVLDRTDIRAPISGTIVGLNIHTIGRVIKPGETLMEIVPQDEKLVVQARINPLDIDVVQKGLKAKIVLSALKTRTTPMLIGEVTRVSAGALQDEQTGQSYYLARITIPPKEIKKLADQSLYPGMPAEVMIITNRITPWQYFTSPIEKSFSRAFKEQ